MDHNQIKEIIIPIVFALSSFSISYIATQFLRKVTLRYEIVDEPGARRSHTDPTPRGGGMAFVFSFIMIFSISPFFYEYNPRSFLGFLFCSSAISILGLLDDLKSLSRNLRVGIWVGITIVAIFFGISIEEITFPLIGNVQLGLFSPLMTFLWLIGVTNFFNFMDGIDGLAASEAIVVSLFLSVIAFLSSNNVVFIASVILFGGSFGFLFHNFPQANIFMGDGGSNFLGFAFAAMAVIISQSEDNSIPFLVTVILLMMFLLDAGTTLIKHLPKGKNWLEPHRDHYYQRLIKSGLSHLQVTLLYSSLNIILGVVAYAYMIATNAFIRTGLLALSVVPFLFVVILSYRRKQRATSG